MNSRFALIVSLLVFRMTLDYTYVKFVHPYFDEHFLLPMLYSFEIGRYLLSLALFAAFCFPMRVAQHSPSNIMHMMLALFTAAPITSQYGLDTTKALVPVLATLIALMISIGIAGRAKADLSREIPDIVARGRPAVIVSILMVIYLIVWSYVSGATDNINFDPDLIYEFRDDASTLLDVGWLSYLNIWTMKVFIIFLVCVGLARKQYGLVALLFAIETYFYALTSHRIIFFLPFLTTFFWYFLTKKDHLTAIPVGGAVVLLLALAGYQWLQNPEIASVTIRRAFYVPSGIVFEWFDYFGSRPSVFWSDGLLRQYIPSEYNGARLPYLIGDVMFYGGGLAANAGLVSSGYAHAGYAGVLAYAVVLGVFLRLLNQASARGVPIWMTAALAVGPLRTAVADTDLPTALLSHGLFLVVAILWTLRANRPRAAVQPVPA